MKKLFSLFCFSILLFTTISCRNDDDTTHNVVVKAYSSNGASLLGVDVLRQGKSIGSYLANGASTWESSAMNIPASESVGITATASSDNTAGEVKVEIYRNGSLYKQGSKTGGGQITASIQSTLNQ